MTKLTKGRIKQFIKSPLEHGLTRSEQMEMARQLLAGLEQEPVAYIGKTMLEDIAGGERHCGRVWAGNEDRLSGESRIPLYAAPQLPQPAVVSDVTRKDFEAWARAAGFNEDWYFFTNAHPNHYDDDHINDMWAAWNACRSAMLQVAEPVHGWIPCSERMPEEIGRYWCYVEEQNSLGKSHYQWNCSWNGDRWWVESENGGRVTHWMPLPAAPQQEVTTDNTTQQLESLGFIVTSDERKMELPRCSKHPETELQVHPFEMLLSYPPKPAMYCPLCRPSVAEWVEFDKQLRQWKEVK